MAKRNLGSVLEFMRLLWAVHHRLQSLSKRMERELGVTGPQRLVIRIVGRSPGVSAGEIAETLHMHPSTLTGVLRRMEEGGLLRRKSHPDDARRAQLSLTAEGKRLNRPEMGLVENAIRQSLRELTEEEVQTVSRALTVLARKLEG